MDWISVTGGWVSSVGARSAVTSHYQSDSPTGHGSPVAELNMIHEKVIFTFTFYACSVLKNFTLCVAFCDCASKTDNVHQGLRYRLTTYIRV